MFRGFWPISSNLLMLYGQVLLHEQYLLFINEKNEFKILTSKFLTRFGPFFGKKNGHFWPKINVTANFAKSSHKILLVLHI